MKKFLSLFIIIVTMTFSGSSAEEMSELAVALYNDNNIENALDVLEKIPENIKSAKDYLLIGNIYDEKGEKEKALSSYKKSTNKDNSFYKAYYNIGNLYFDKKEYHSAIYYYNIASKYDKNAYIHYNLGCAYLKIGDLKNANSEFSRTIKIQDNIPEAYYNLAYTYKRLGNKKQAENNINIYNQMKSVE